MRELLLLLIIYNHLLLTNLVNRNASIWIKELRDLFIARMMDLILSKMPRIYSILKIVWHKLIFTFYTLPRIFIKLITFPIIPNMIVVISFIIDVYYYGRIYIFYKVIVLLLIPIIFNIIIDLLKHEVSSLNAIYGEWWIKLVLTFDTDTRMFYMRVILRLLQGSLLIKCLSIL